jgi:hypothetical protein
MPKELRKARRELARLTRRMVIASTVEGLPLCEYAIRNEARRMARELVAQIKRQELECRRLTPGNYLVRQSGLAWEVHRADGRLIHRYGPNATAKLRAVKRAERQNRKGMK